MRILLSLLILAATPEAAPPAKNLKVLPRDWTRGQVVERVMKKWTGDLGVRCQHCHVGEESQPFNEWNFESDAKPAKQRAREMYVMLGEINKRLGAMSDLHGRGAPQATCFTCHRGMAEPRTIDDVFEETRASKGIDAAIEQYRQLRQKQMTGGGYDFGVKPLVRVARARLAAKDTQAGRKVMNLALELGYDVLATRSVLSDLAAAEGDMASAVAQLEKAMAVAANPAEKEFLEEQLRKLRGSDH